MAKGASQPAALVLMQTCYNERRTRRLAVMCLNEMSMTLNDTLNRPLRDLRISVTDRCNFRCVYCMPKDVFGSDYQFLHRDQILTFEEITRLARLFHEQGVRKIRLT